MNIQEIVATTMRVLNHGCAVSADIASACPSIEGLHHASRLAACQHDSQGSAELPASIRWEWDESSGRLSHTTSTGRIKISATRYAVDMVFFAGPDAPNGLGRSIVQVRFDKEGVHFLAINSELLDGRPDRISVMVQMNQYLGFFLSGLQTPTLDTGRMALAEAVRLCLIAEASHRYSLAMAAAERFRPGTAPYGTEQGTDVP